ncbi:MAG: D-2-hydroxyacid dehydrogenase [Chloroflexi bacterium]|nr:MAG: D-2-hydroxyacid dehydrogenase [Chloroflexota bacterium]
MTNIAVGFDLHPELVARIAAVDPAVRVRSLAQGARASFGGRMPYPTELQARTTRAELEAALPEAEVLFAPWAGALRELSLPDTAPHLRWVQLTHAGAELVPPALARAITFTTAGDISSSWIAEWVASAMLMFAKGWPQRWRDQQAHGIAAVEASEPRALAGSTVGIVGMGAIGTRVARLAKGLGCRVIGMRRSFTVRGPDALADEGVPPHDLAYLLGASDYVLLSAPLTPETQHLIDATALRAMRRSGVLINVGRGALIDESALIEALRGGVIAGAALDVFTEEPLPADSSLWDLPTAMLAPHVAGGSDRYYERATEVFCDNLRRYLAGGPLLHRVEPERGY